MIGAVQSKNVPVEPEPSRRFNLLFTVEGSGIQGTQTYACEHIDNCGQSYYIKSNSRTIVKQSWW